MKKTAITDTTRHAKPPQYPKQALYLLKLC